jgi:hypothetical protein
MTFPEGGEMLSYESVRSACWVLIMVGGSACTGEPRGHGHGGTGSPDPGALIAVRAHGTVGVLLDEIDPGVREVVASEVLLRTEEQWTRLAQEQLDFAYYRLTFRPYFYVDVDPPKGRLPLPPPQLWSIALDGPARRGQIDGHDFVLVDYAFDSTLLTDVASPKASEIELGVIGGEWVEPLIFPLDPQMLLERTGYACIDEFEYPSDSVDEWNAHFVYDQECTVDADYCHQKPAVEDCVDALIAHVGHVEVPITYRRLPWDEALAREVRVGEPPSVDGADLIVVEDGIGLAENRVVYRYTAPGSCEIEEGTTDAVGWHRLLAFNSTSWNIGNGPMHVGDVDLLLADDEAHGLFDYGECHGHWHFSHYADFGVRDARGQLLAGDKRSFCLESTNRFSNAVWSPLSAPYDRCHYQGISPGWGDMYQAGLSGQWVVIDQIMPGPATLSAVANPDGLLCEGLVQYEADGVTPLWQPTPFSRPDGRPVDTLACADSPGALDNNLGEVGVTIPELGRGAVTGPCLRGEIGPRRECGFEYRGVFDCTPGEAIVLPFVAASGLLAPQLRICEASAVLDAGVACTWLQAVATASGTSIAFTCPELRDAPGSGGYSLYVGDVTGSGTPAAGGSGILVQP